MTTSPPSKPPRRDPQRQTAPRDLSRRDLLRGTAGLMALGASGALGCGGGDPLDGSNRVAIVGGGAGGIATAYFLQGLRDVDLFEAGPKIGGHCDSRVVEYAGQQVTVDVGAQFFHPETHPLYTTLLEVLGLYDPDHPDADETLQAPGSLCVFPVGGGAPVFSSTHPLDTPSRAVDFAGYAQAARAAVLDGLSWETTLDAWIGTLSASADFKDQVLYPWITATIGATRAAASRSSARSILQTFALAFPANIFEGATTYNSTLGLGGNLQRLLDQCPDVRVSLSAEVRELVRDAAGQWFVRTASEEHGPYRAVVLNAPPRVGRELLRPMAWAAEIVALLDQVEYFDSRLVIHTDPVYVHGDRASWAAYNAGVDGLECEGSAWLGALHPPLPGGATIDVFKSWAQHRRDEPAEILVERRFQHPLITPVAIRAARALAAFQGKNGLHFGGQYTTGMDLQESALYSAMKVTELLAPASATLAALRMRLVERGRTGISYDL